MWTLAFGYHEDGSTVSRWTHRRRRPGSPLLLGVINRSAVPAKKLVVKNKYID
jgi:hypothetical protein